jgi:acyl-coenzyme A synthetase/AMP-(fatty) acid ligase
VVHFVGRADSQIKSRGYRIELGEIETALNRIAVLAESAVVAVASDGFEGTAICCAYAPLPGAAVAPPVVRAELSTVLPAYMLPARWLELDALPKNVNGKIDRAALRERFASGERAATTVPMGEAGR